MSTNLGVFPKNARINEKGHLEIAGIDAVDLVREFGTPLFVYDEEHLRDNCRRYVRAFTSHGVEHVVAYASKAFMTIAMAQLAYQEGLWLDVSTGGELYTALAAGVPGERLLFHGNNKSLEELELALDNQVGLIVVDNFNEVEMLDALMKRRGGKQRVLIRVTPGIIPSTHSYIQTGQVDTKFGFGLTTGLAMEAAIEVLNRETLALEGFHIHIGSQIFALNSFERAVEVICGFVADVRSRTGYAPAILDLGGGLGVAYRRDDTPATIEEFVNVLISSLKRECESRNLSLPFVIIEPGRSVVANACVTLYTVGAVKEIPGVRTYISVDGGMSDNLRPMLYGAVYEAALANRMTDSPDLTVTIAGKHCESGDILARDVWLPSPRPGDILVMPVTGAYGYAMANNYNRQPRAAVVFAAEGRARVVVRRETYEDIVRLDLPLA